jgi:hypothetical protein
MLEYEIVERNIDMVVVIER